MTKQLRILHLEPNDADAKLVSAALVRSHGHFVVERVADFREFAMSLRESEPGVVLSDHTHPHTDAVAVLDEVRAVRPCVPLIVVAAASDPRDTIACVRAGVADVVPKYDLPRLVHSIESALISRVALEKLSPRQIEVLRLVAEGHSTPEIARRLTLSIKTVETHRGEVMKRLGIHDVVRLVRYAVRQGIVALP